MSEHKEYMQMALKLAQKGAGRVSPNPMVGAVIVKSGTVVGKGYHKKYGSHHAEINALKQAGNKAKEATLYVTLEPCLHFGKTPPCVDAIINAGIKHVVMAMKDPNPLINGKSVTKLKKEKIKVTIGVCEKEGRDLNKSFIKSVTEKKPYVMAKVGQSLDGMITTQKGKQGWITGEKSKQYVQKLRAEVDAILVGDETIKIDDPQLNVRKENRPQPLRVVLDPELKISLKSRVFHVRGGSVILMCGLKNDHRKVVGLRKKGVDIIANVPVTGKKLRLSSVLKKLYERNIQKILVEGGAQVFQSFFKKNLVDEWQIIVAPKVIGDQGLSWMRKGDERKLTVEAVKSLGEDELFICSGR
ncbi:bifunctional diaminohydroxyphosphoribosylaminopyrimidine deaminase/5-amino-6-(5-phosphoribosylamino)uracil reductase RibD [bacterium]|nr:bifunctional diaminohydroxyphosphoribosylaminopyrimidine deaminase/5-amino-6-(5-phosphoribosylamino)uracil reductase RibD [bacterium]MBU1917598.1 bifunctional diaminohydroxyphosphoribosylaminopyrimidine deaminase/5-amino-6-(5-phosphoribosylamino)uracil reductase RibD [bacterium]